jgi:hypothetical protein
MLRFLRDHPRIFFSLILCSTTIFTIGRALTDTIKPNRSDNETLSHVGPAISIFSSGSTLIISTFITSRNTRQPFYPFSNDPPLVRDKQMPLMLFAADVCGTIICTAFYSEPVSQSLIVSWGLVISNVNKFEPVELPPRRKTFN